MQIAREYIPASIIIADHIAELHDEIDDANCAITIINLRISELRFLSYRSGDYHDLLCNTQIRMRKLRYQQIDTIKYRIAKLQKLKSDLPAGYAIAI